MRNILRDFGLLVLVLGIASAPNALSHAFADTADPLPPPDDNPTFVEEPAVKEPAAGPQQAEPASAELSVLPVVVAGSWTSQGPGPSLNGQVENIANRPVVGAVHTVAAHPTSAGTLYIGAVNGGIWKTTNATAASPTWTAQTDTNTSLSIGALEFDPTDGTNNTLVAGIGRFSSFSGTGGSRAGLLRTTTGGSSWTELTGGGTLLGKNISGVAPRGATLVVSVDVADSFTCDNIGIFRSTNTGASFSQVLIGSGLPAGVNNDLAGDPSSTSTLYTTVIFADICNSVANGIFKSTDTGATWTRVSNAAMEALMISGTTSNVEIAVGSSNNVYVGIINAGQLVGLFRSGNGGTTWTQMDTPTTNENGFAVGIQPHPSGDGSPGGQGVIHFSIRADPTNANVVYVGGDRQPSQLDGAGTETGAFPNSIGAFDYSGRLFRGNASLAPGSQWVHLTHSRSLGPAGGGTASSSAPHADSREMVFDANGNLIETDDGGVYKRTSPANNTGDWFSLNGDLRVTEFHDIAYDARSEILIGGAQDVGTDEQSATGSATWTDLTRADGGDVAVDDTTVAGQSTRYMSNQSLLNFRRRVYDASNVLQSQTFPALTVTGGGAALVPLFLTPVELNSIVRTRLVIVGMNSIYESLDKGDTITEIGPGQGPGADIRQNAVAYGSRQSGVGKPEVLYVGVNTNVLVRPAGGGPLTASFGYVIAGGGTVRDVVVDPDDWMHAFAADDNQVFQTTNGGTSWTDVTGNLGALGAVDFRSLAYIPSGANDRLALAARGKVFVAFQTDFTVWDQLGTGLPNTLIYDLEYDAADDLLAAGSFGRGAWTLPNASGGVPTPTPTITSPLPNTPTNTPTPTFTSTPAGAALVVNPPTRLATLGQNFDVEIVVQAGSQSIDGAAAYLNFDPAILHVVSISAGSALPLPIQNAFNNTAGTVDYSAGTFSNFPTGTITVATVTFNALAVSAGTALTFTTQPPRQSDVTFGGASVLTSLQNGTVIVSATCDTDSDGDGICDANDNCPYAANPGQEDTGGIGASSGPDGIGDACQCGDVNGNGRVTIGDSVIILRSLLSPPTATLTRPELCDVGGSVACSLADSVILLRANLSPPTATVLQQCAPARPPS